MMGMIETFIYTQSYNLANTLHIVAVVSDSYQKLKVEILYHIKESFE